MTGAPLFTSVIVTWNSEDHLGDCINAMRRSEERCEASVEIIVVDNASDDGSRQIATAAGADLVIHNPVNAGFAVAASQGIARALGSWIIMTNPDLVVDDDFVSVVACAVDTAPAEVACFAPEIRFAADTTRVNSRGIAVDEIGLPTEIGKGQLVDEAPIPESIFAGSGGGSVLRRTSLDLVGAFDPLYFAYYEDVDLGWRLQRAGFRARYLSDAHASHAGSSTVGVASPLQTYLVARNRRFLFNRHGPHDLKARIWRSVTDIGHAVVLCVITRGPVPVLGRVAALRSHAYLRFLTKTDAATLGGAPHEALVARVGFGAALRRKMSSIALEKRS